MDEVVQLNLPDLDLAALDRFAGNLLPLLRRGDFIALSGELGAGKTAFARALILRLLGDNSAEEVPSPSFAIMQSYETPRLKVHHYDFYRLSSADEIIELGLDDAMAEGLVLAEWPDRLGEDVPKDHLEIQFRETDDPDQRNLKLVAVGAFAARLQRFIDIDRFLFDARWNKAWRHFLQGDASARSYTRLTLTSERALLMDAPRQPDGPPIRDGKPYSVLAHLAENVRPFVAITQKLADLGYSAPKVFAADLDKGLLLLEDFGDRAFGDVIAQGTDMTPLYETATRLLADLAQHAPPPDLPLPDGRRHALPAYDWEALSIEAELLLDWFWPAARNSEAPDDLRRQYLDLWRAALAPVLAASGHWALRDAHSPNLIWLPERDGVQKVGLIDFQDAQIGHRAYDPVSLLQDARLDVPVELEQACLRIYLDLAREREPDFDEQAFLSAYATLGAQRNTKILGIFIRLAKRDQKTAYLAHIPRVAGYLARNLQHPALTDLKSWYDDHIPLDDVTGLLSLQDQS